MAAGSTARRSTTGASTKWFPGSFVLRMRCCAFGCVPLALPVWTGLFKGLFRVPRDVRVHWQSQCHPTVTFQRYR